MSRFTFAAGVGLAALVIVPTTVDGHAAPASLEEALARTIAALEHLAGVEQRLRERDPAAIEMARAATEPPLTAPDGDPAWRDAKLDELRRDVTRLQGELEHDTATVATPQAQEPVESRALAAPTTGLDDAARDALAASVRGGMREVATAAKAQDGAKQAFEPDGYAADPTQLGHAYFRRRDFEHALALFSVRADDDLDASYWRARCLEQLGRADEAIAALERIVAGGKVAWAVDRAREDLDFLKWRATFDRKLAQRAKEQK